MFVRSKVAKGATYYAVVESFRDGPKVRQRTILSMGQHPTVESLLTSAKAHLRRARRAWKRLSGLTEVERAMPHAVAAREALDAATAYVAELERVAGLMGVDVGTTPPDRRRKDKGVEAVAPPP